MPLDSELVDARGAASVLAAYMSRRTALVAPPPPPPPPPAYAPAEGCDLELDGWCRKWCPRNWHGSPLVARRIVPTPYGVLWWGCFPLRLFAKDDFSAEDIAQTRHCAKHSTSEKGKFMTPEQRHLIRTFRACKTTLKWRRRGNVSDYQAMLAHMEPFLAARDAKGKALKAARKVDGASLFRSSSSIATTNFTRRWRRSILNARADAAASSGVWHARPLAAASSSDRLPSCEDGSAYASVLVGTKWGNTYLSRVGSSATGGVANSADSQLGLQHQLLVTLIQSIRYHETICRRPYILLTGANVSVDRSSLSPHLKRLGVTIRRITTLSERVPSLNKLFAFLLTEYRKVLAVDSDALALQPLESLFSEEGEAAPFGGGGAAASMAISMASHAYDTEQAVCNITIGHRVNGGLVLLRPNSSVFEELVPTMWREIECHRVLGTTTGKNTTAMRAQARADDLLKHAAKIRIGVRSGAVEDAMTATEAAMRLPSIGSKGCYKNEQTAFACYYHKRSALHPLGCHAFYDHGLFSHGTNSLHHTRCKKANLDWSGHSASTCDAIAKHVDHTCKWEQVRSKVLLIHFKGKSKPFKHIPSHCSGVRLGAYHLYKGAVKDFVSGQRRYKIVSGSSKGGAGARHVASPVDPRSALEWDEIEKGCRLAGSPKGVEWHKVGEVRFADGTEVPKGCCETHYLQQGEWYYHALMAGLTPPAPIW